MGSQSVTQDSLTFPSFKINVPGEAHAVCKDE